MWLIVVGTLSVHTSATEYMKKVEKELIDLCNKLINLVEEKLLTMSSAKDASVFYLKVCTVWVHLCRCAVLTLSCLLDCLLA